MRTLLGTVDDATMKTIMEWKTCSDEDADAAKRVLSMLTNNEINEEEKVGVKMHSVSRIAEPRDDDRMYRNYTIIIPDKPGQFWHVFEGTKEIAKWDSGRRVPIRDNFIFYGDKLIFHDMD